jgi:hypothetical protein
MVIEILMKKIPGKIDTYVPYDDLTSLVPLENPDRQSIDPINRGILDAYKTHNRERPPYGIHLIA